MLNFLLYATTVAIWGSTWLVITLQLQQAAITTAIGWRFLLACLILIGWCRLRGLSLACPPRHWPAVMLQGMTNFALNYWLVYLAEARIASGLVAMIFTSLMLFNMIGGRLVYGQSLTRRAMAGAALGMAGVAAVFWPELERFESGSTALAGMLLALAGSLCASVGNLLSLHTQRTAGMMPTLTIGMGAGGAGMLAIAALRGDSWRIPLTLDFIGPLLYLSLFGSVIAFAAYVSLMSRVGAGRAAYNGVVIPVVALALSTLFENYHWHALSLVGVSLSLAGNILVMQGKYKG